MKTKFILLICVFFSFIGFSNAQDTLFTDSNNIYGVSNAVLYDDNVHFGVFTHSERSFPDYPNENSRWHRLYLCNENLTLFPLRDTAVATPHCVLRVSPYNDQQLYVHFEQPYGPNYTFYEYINIWDGNDTIPFFNNHLPNWRWGNFQIAPDDGAFHVIFQAMWGYFPVYLYYKNGNDINERVVEANGTIIKEIHTLFDDNFGFHVLAKKNLAKKTNYDLVLYRLSLTMNHISFVDENVQFAFDYQSSWEKGYHALYLKDDKLKLAKYDTTDISGMIWQIEDITNGEDILDAKLIFRPDSTPVIAYKTDEKIIVIEKKQTWDEVYSIQNTAENVDGLSLLYKNGDIHLFWADRNHVYLQNIDRYKTKIKPAFITISQPVAQFVENKSLAIKTSKYNGVGIPPCVEKYLSSKKTANQWKRDTKLPGFIDWSYRDSPVCDQGDCGSCWAYATTALVENLLGLDCNLSVRNLLDSVGEKNGIPNNCSSGWPGFALRYIHEKGIPRDTDYLLGEYLQLIKIQKYNYFALWGDSIDIEQLKEVLVDGPVVAAMLLPKNFKDDYTRGIYRYSGEKEMDTIRHAILITGYNDNESYFRCKNSWGSEWGENGYFRIHYNAVTSPVQFGAYAVTASDAFFEQKFFTIANQSALELEYSLNTEERIDLDKQNLVLQPNEKDTIHISIPDWSQIAQSEFTDIHIDTKTDGETVAQYTIQVQTIPNTIKQESSCEGTAMEATVTIEKAQLDGKNLAPGDEFEIDWGGFKKIISVPASEVMSIPITFFICSGAINTSPRVSYRKKGTSAQYKSKVIVDSLIYNLAAIESNQKKNKENDLYMYNISIEMFSDSAICIEMPDTTFSKTKHQLFQIPLRIINRDNQIIRSIETVMRIPEHINITGLDMNTEIPQNEANYEIIHLSENKLQVKIDCNNWSAHKGLVSYLSFFADTMKAFKLIIENCKVNGKSVYSKDANISFNNVMDKTALEFDKISVYPQPSANGTIHLIYNIQNKERFALSVFDITGKKVKQLKNLKTNTNNRISFPGFKGMYIGKIDQTNTCFKIVLE